ncbi:type VI secretion system baseplate subunit TssF [Ideonella alba]|uniref:Type VI secretion system baseplate subunit TssF n=1 Tax=Ideonella alba TaxID=2824118 RepID=A0A940Y5W0_9BURK|nr:type VI secretion system baseplate subunit TssF [Ideonella alba]MBQ0930382.1 type VI secretion system baseplate subunit TssF [Ideonella alba]
MDARLLRYYNQELRYLYEVGAEFAAEFPKIASRLGMESMEVTDPYVERLLEGCAFLAARVQLRQDSEFPRFSHRLLELLYPNFLAPIPSMLVAQVHPVPDANLLKAPPLPRDLPLYAPPLANTSTRCEYRTASPLRLTPLSTTQAEYLLNLADLNIAALGLPERPRAGIRVRLQLPAGMKLSQLDLDSLRFYVGGPTEVAMRVHELVLGSTVGVLAGAPGLADSRQLLPASAVQPVGYSDDEAMLPVTLRGFGGVRLLQEHFTFPERFLFIDIQGLRPVLQRLDGHALELTLLLNRPGTGLEGVVDASHFMLHCVPAVNLFTKRMDRIQVDDGQYEFHVVPDRTAPLDFEVYDLLSLTGYDDKGDERRFMPMFAPDHRAPTGQPAYYSSWREPRLPSEAARREGPRSGYIGSEVFVSLVDPEEAPYSGDLRQVALKARCTNRDLPIFIPMAGGQAEFQLDAPVPLNAVRVVNGPSRPQTALREGGVAWRLLNLLSLNYLSLLDTEGGEAAAALRDLLSRFPMAGEPAQRRQIESLQGVRTRPVVRRHPVRGPIAFGRGIEVELTVDELGHEGGSAYLFGAALHHYLARHASLNSFVETSLVSLSRGPIARWKPMLGQRPVL